MKLHLLLSLLLLVSTSFAAVDMTYYHGQGCSHCATTGALLTKLTPEYKLNITTKEVYFNPQNNVEMLNLYSKFGMDSTQAGVPTIIIRKDVMVIGELSESQWRDVFTNASKGTLPSGIYTAKTFKSISFKTTPPKKSDNNLTLAVLLGAAIVDSINPCTIAVMTMLLAAILTSGDRRKALFAGLLFSFTVFIMYLLMGLGIFQAITNTNLQVIFFVVVTLGAGILALLELRAFFYYQPGMVSVEMPLFLRPHAKAVTGKATTYSAVFVAAVLCSLFLLPCSSGPYLVVLGMLAKQVSTQTLGYLFLYNFVFILPMLLITIAIYWGKTTVEKMEDFKDTYIRELHLVAGVILVILFLIMLKDLLSLLNII